MEKYDPRGDLATRDTVARAIDTEMKESGDDCVFLDISHKPAEFIKNRFPNIYQTCLSLGIDMTKEPIPVVPAAHYMCGGVMTDIWGRTNIESLYALGETACTGLHGGNRLASNSLLEAVVFAHQAFLKCNEDKEQLLGAEFCSVPDWSSGKAKKINEGVLVSHNWDQIRRLMWNYVGIVRNERRLGLVKLRLAPILIEIAQHFRNYLLTPDLIELRNISLVAELIVQSSLQRKESRGLHCMVDYPEPDDENWLHDTILCRHDKTVHSYLLES
jgi:L-aspartate oxidase